MNELTPLLASSDDELELALLRSVNDDEPGANALPKTALALGLGTLVLTTAPAAGGTATVAAAGALAKHGGVTLLAIMKWLAMGATAGLVTSGTVYMASRSSAPAPSAAPVVAGAHAEGPRGTERLPAMPAAPAAPTPATTAPAENPAVPAEPAAPAVAAPRQAAAPLPEPEAEPAPATRLPAPGESSASFEPIAPAGRGAEPPAAGSSLADETRALDRVRHELEARRPGLALAELNHFRERWPKGALRAEAAVLRVEALLQSGDRAGAEREADVLIRIAPHSRHAARVRELLSR